VRKWRAQANSLVGADLRQGDPLPPARRVRTVAQLEPSLQQHSAIGYCSGTARAGQRRVLQEYRIATVNAKAAALIAEGMKVRVTFVVRSLAVGGAERQLAYIAPALASHGHDVGVVVLSKNLAFGKSLVENGVRLVCFEKRSRWQFGRWFKDLRREIVSRTPGVVCGWMPAEALMTYLVVRTIGRIPFVWSIRGSDLDLSDYDFVTASVFRVHRWIIRRRFGSAVISNSYAGARVYGATEADSWFRVIWNAVDTESFLPSDELRRRERERLGLNEGRPVVAIVGRLDPMKDHLTFLRAAAQVARARPDAVFLIVGDGGAEVRTAIVDQTRGAGLEAVVRLEGARSDIPAVMNAADVVVSTSKGGEGVQNSLVEAMACGRPVVATDVGDARRFLSDDDSVVPRGDDVGVAREILVQLGRDTPALRAKRMEHARTTFSLERVCVEMEEVLARVQLDHARRRTSLSAH
jgi:glycosyltransferase involved in cell wall biosynthesis